MRRPPIRFDIESNGDAVIPPATLAAFFGASLLLALAPGPDNLFVLVESARHGRGAGLRVTLGLCTGLVVHTAAVACGLAALLSSSPAALALLKSAGALYLAWLALGAFRAAGPAVPGGEATASPSPPDGLALYRRGIVMNVTNPKVTLFFLAFLPQFASPARGPLELQVALLGAVFMLATLLVFGAVAVFAGASGRLLAGSPAARRALERVAGCVFLGLAVRLLLDGR